MEEEQGQGVPLPTTPTANYYTLKQAAKKTHITESAFRQMWSRNKGPDHTRLPGRDGWFLPKESFDAWLHERVIARAHERIIARAHAAAKPPKKLKAKSRTPIKKSPAAAKKARPQLVATLTIIYDLGHCDVDLLSALEHIDEVITKAQERAVVESSGKLMGFDGCSIKI